MFVQIMRAEVSGLSSRHVQKQRENVDVIAMSDASCRFRNFCEMSRENVAKVRLKKFPAENFTRARGARESGVLIFQHALRR